MAKVTKRLRYEVLRRDGFRCRYCGATPAQAELRVDHVIPDALGGSSEPTNLATSCEPCNSGKSSVAPDAETVVEVSQDSIKWTRALQEAAAAKEAEILERRSHFDWFLELWNEYKMPLPIEWPDALTRLEAAGLTRLLVEEAVTSAMIAYKVHPENRFRYFMGCSWNMVADLQATAQQLATLEEPDRDPYPGVPRSVLASQLHRLEQQAEHLLLQVPSWMRTNARWEAFSDREKAGERDRSRLEVLPDVVRHLGHALSACQILSEGDA
jgi:hypothetical protein